MTEHYTAEAAQARDPATSAEALGLLADMHPELHALIIANPSCPDDVSQWILDNNPDLASQVAREQARRTAAAAASSATSTLEPATVSPTLTPEAPPRSHAGKVVVVAIFLVVAVLIVRAIQTAQASSDSSDQEVVAPQEPVSPAPADALSATVVSAPSNNIFCVLQQDSVACSIAVRYYAQNGQEDCAGATYFSVATGESTSLACGQEFVGPSADMTQLDYGQSTANDTYACSSAETGMTCWNQMTGHGFTLAREGYSTF